MRALSFVRIIICGLVLLHTIGAGAQRGDTGGAAHGQTYEELISIPKDPDEAQRVRVWLGLTREANCRVTVDIFDRQGNPVRQLMSRLMKAGYYNLYWDKKDDSGRYVDDGTYAVVINDCGKIKNDSVVAFYRPWERYTSLEVFGERSSPVFRLTLDGDSALTRLVIVTLRADTVATALPETVLVSGVHEIPFPVGAGLTNGAYLVVLLINEEFVREERFQYTP